MVYKWYILPIGGLYGTYHLLREPETTIDSMTKRFRKKHLCPKNHTPWHRNDIQTPPCSRSVSRPCKKNREARIWFSIGNLRVTVTKPLPLAMLNQPNPNNAETFVWFQNGCRLMKPCDIRKMFLLNFFFVHFLNFGKLGCSLYTQKNRSRGASSIWATKKKHLLLSIESWLVNRDPYNGLLQSPYNWVV